MKRQEISPRREEVTSDELVACYADLAEREPLLVVPAEPPPPAPAGELGLLAVVEGREGEPSPPPARATPRTERRAASQDAESYAVGPDLERLRALADYGREEAAVEEPRARARPPLELA